VLQDAADRAIGGSLLNTEMKGAILAEYGELGWANEFELALRFAEEACDGEAHEVARKLEALLGRQAAPGDLPSWFRCCVRVVAFGLSVTAAVLAGGAPVVLVASAGGSLIALADGLHGCRGESRRPPSIAEELGDLVKHRDRGDLTPAEFAAAKRKVLGISDDAAAALQRDIEDFSPALKRAIPAPRPFRIRKPDRQP
jgi:hypothetical protein